MFTGITDAFANCMKNRIHLVLLSVGVSLALLMFVFATAKADITINIIDHFDTSQTVTAIGPNGTDANSLVDPNVLGGERDVQVQVTAGAPTDNINVTTNSGGNRTAVTMPLKLKTLEPVVFVMTNKSALKSKTRHNFSPSLN